MHSSLNICLQIAREFKHFYVCRRVLHNYRINSDIMVPNRIVWSEIPAFVFGRFTGSSCDFFSL